MGYFFICTKQNPLVSLIYFKILLANEPKSR